MKITDDKGFLTQESLKQLKALSSHTTCECPKHLADILHNIREFRDYQKKCLKEKPEDSYIHEWLASSTLTLDALLSGMILQLANLEGFIDLETGRIEGPLGKTGIGKARKGKIKR